MTNDCNQCRTKFKERLLPKSSFLSALLIVIIPKCAFCVMAYSSAIALCGGDRFYHSTNNWVSYLPLALTLFIIFVLIRTFKGTRTYLALSTAFIAAGFILAAHQLWLPAHFYDLGTVLLFMAIWVNSNFFHVIDTIKQKIVAKPKHA